jgi:hypothetical protein
LKFVQEVTRRSSTPAAMLLLDFTKAYDRVQHIYIWEILRAIGMAEEFITLI